MTLRKKKITKKKLIEKITKYNDVKGLIKKKVIIDCKQNI